VPIDLDLIADGDFNSLHSGIAGARLLLNRPDPPTAIFAFNETLAVGALGAAREVGLDVPRVDSTV
jgi:LacI family transcriptional regulator